MSGGVGCYPHEHHYSLVAFRALDLTLRADPLCTPILAPRGRVDRLGG